MAKELQVHLKATEGEKELLKRVARAYGESVSGMVWQMARYFAEQKPTLVSEYMKPVREERAWVE